jgi:uncharacterized repeat protein (TIGR01451 family)
MKRNALLIGAIVAAFVGLAAVLLTLPAQAAPTSATRAVEASITHTTLEDFNAGNLYYTGLTNFDGGEVQLLVVGLAGEWITTTNTTGLEALARHTAVYTNDHIIVLGGRNAMSKPSNRVFYTTINPSNNHDLEDWNLTTPLPPDVYPDPFGGSYPGVYWHASVILNDRVYVLGGSPDGSATYDTISYATVNGAGTVGEWLTTTVPLPHPMARFGAVVVNGRIYVIGGWSFDENTFTSQVYDEVYFATPEADGDIEGWTPTTDFAYPTYGHMVAAYNGRIYVMGGFDESQTNNVAPFTHYATPITSTGVITQWAILSNMKNNIFAGAGLAFGDVLYTTGGAINSLYEESFYVGASLINAEGKIGQWVDTSLIEPARLYHAAVHSDDGWIYVINGSGDLDGDEITEPMLNINRGSTTGVGEQYAPEGTFTSATMDLGGLNKLKELRWNTTITDTDMMTITVRYHTRNEPGGPWSAWHGPYSSSPTPGTVTTTVELDGHARYVEYEARLEAKDLDGNGTARHTPVLNAVQLVYEKPAYLVRIHKEAEPPSGTRARPGDILSYTLTYSNGLEGITATHVVILDTMPEYTTFKEGSVQGPGVYDSETESIRWELESLEPGSQGEVGFAVVISPTLMHSTIIANSATIDSNQGPIWASNVVTHPVQVSYEILVSKDAEPEPGSPVAPGTTIAYTLHYVNSGTENLSDIVLTDALPDQVTYVADSIWGAEERDDGDPANLQWSISNLASGGEGTAGFNVVVNDDVTEGITITNVAIVDSDQTDPLTSPAVSHVVHLAPPSLSLTKSADPVDGSTVEPGQRIDYVLEYANNGEMPIIDLVLTDVVPDYVTYVDGSVWPAAKGDASDVTELHWDLGAVDPGEEGTVGFAVTVNDVPGSLSIENSFTGSNAQIDLQESNRVEHTTYRQAPDFYISKIAAIPADPSPGQPFDLVVTVKNAGSHDADTGDFWTEVYIKPLPSTPPQAPSDHYLGMCTDQACTQTVRYEYVEGLTSLDAGSSATLRFKGLVLPGGGDYDIYAQADISFDGDDPTWGRYVEQNESNNVARIILGGGIIHLPLIATQYTR